jgi:hypothetical protein
VKMFKKYSPLVCYTTRCDDRISKNLKSYLTAEVVGHLDFQHGVSFKITAGKYSNEIYIEHNILLLHRLVCRQMSLW